MGRGSSTGAKKHPYLKPGVLPVLKRVKNGKALMSDGEFQELCKKRRENATT